MDLEMHISCLSLVFQRDCWPLLENLQHVELWLFDSQMDFLVLLEVMVDSPETTKYISSMFASVTNGSEQLRLISSIPNVRTLDIRLEVPSLFYNFLARECNFQVLEKLWNCEDLP